MSKSRENQAMGDIRGATATAGQRAGAAFDPALAGYENFAQTGGVSAQESDLARRQTSYGISSLYDAMKRNLGRRQRIQGGYAPGLGAGEAQLGRQGSEAVAQGLTGTNLGLLEMTRQGKLAGLGGLGGLYGSSLGAQMGGLGTQAGLASRMKGPWSNFLEGADVLGRTTANIAKAMSAGSNGGGG